MTISSIMRGTALSGLLAVAAPLQAQADSNSLENRENESDSINSITTFSAEYLTLEDEAEAAARQQLTLAARSDTGDAAFGPVPTQVQVQSGIKGETVRLTLGTSLSDWKNFKETSFAVTLTAPFNKNDERGSFITQTGLPDAYSIEAAISGSFIAPSSEVGRQNVMVELVHLTSEALNSCKDQEADDTKCNGLQPAALANKYGDSLLKKRFSDISSIVTSAMARQKYFGWQLSGSVGRESFDHRNPLTLAAIEQDETVFSFSGSFTYVPSLDQPFSYVAGIEFERDYKLPKKEIRCPADAMGDPTVTCFNAAYGPPTREQDATIFGAIRYTDLGSNLPIGGELRLAVDPDNGEWGAEMPIYFLRSAEGALNGGIRVAYDSEEDDVFVGLFVGKSFGSLID